MDFTICTINNYDSLYSLWLQVPGMGLNGLGKEGLHFAPGSKLPE